jgi:hypothetical protein
VGIVSIELIQHSVLCAIVGSVVYRLILNVKLITNPSQYLLVHLLVALFIVLYYNFVFHKYLLNWIIERKEYKSKLKSQRYLMNGFLTANYEKEQIDILRSNINFMKRREFYDEVYTNKVEKELKLNLKEASKVLKEKEYKKRIEELSSEKDFISEEIQELKQKKKRLENKEKSEIEDILEELDVEEETVFYKDDLSEKEIEVLKKEGFRQSNEYSIFSNQNETVLIKPVLNHSNTHIFLSYQIKELLEDMELDNVQEHLTRDADITFKYKNRYYAIEVETGNLLKKKKQLKEKIEYLNKKYKNRWLFVVTNKNYVSEYKKYGFTTQRSQVKKTLEKWLKINTQ